MDNKQSVRKDAQKLEVDSWTSTEGHYAASRRWARINVLIGAPTAVVAAIAGSTILADPSNTLARWVVAILTLSIAALTAYEAWVGSEKRRAEHQDAGNDYLRLKVDAHNLWTYGLNERSEADLQEQLQELIGRQLALQEKSPQIPTWALTQANKAIEARSSQYKEFENA